MRLLLLCLLFAPALFAQDSETLNGSVPSNRRITYLYEVDFGGSTQAWTLNVSLFTNAGTGLAISLIDLDGFSASAQASPTSINSSAVTSAGTVNATLNGNYSGLHSFAVEIETAQGTAASDYDGSITASVGTLALLQQGQFVKTAPGMKLSVGKFAFWDGSVPLGSTVALSLDLDFGTGGTRFLRFEGFGSGLDKIEFIDVTGGSAFVLATFNNPVAGMIASVPMTHSGKAQLRINVRAATGGPGSGGFSVNAPSDVDLDLVGDPGKGGSSDCSAGDQPGQWALFGALLAALFVFRRRSTKKGGPFGPPTS